jgi:hypothetical protein
MIHVINAYASTALGTIFGCLASHSTGGFSLATEAALVWDLETYDETNWHSTSTNTSRFTVPFGVTLAKVTSCLSTANSGNPRITTKRNGSDFHGQILTEGRDSEVGIESAVGMTAIIPVSEGDYFETFGINQAGSTSDVDNTWMSIEAIDPALHRVLVRKSANQSLSAGTDTVMTWDVEEYDTNGFHDNVTNNSRLTAPTTGRYRVCVNMIAASATGQFVIYCRKNGTDTIGLPRTETDSTGIENLNGVSGVIELTAGDYIEATAFHTSATSVTAGTHTWFSMEQIPSSYKCCLATKSATQSISAGVSTNITFNTEVYDDATIHDNVTNNTRFVVPAGCTRARPSFGIRTPSGTGQLAARVTKNGANYIGAPRYDTGTAGADTVNGIGAWVPVVPGDYFELVGFSTDTQSVSATPLAFFCLECQ